MKKLVMGLLMTLLLILFATNGLAEESIGQKDVYFWDAELDQEAVMNLDVYANENYVYAFLPDGSISIVYYLGDEKTVDIAAAFPNAKVTSISLEAFNAFNGLNSDYLDPIGDYIVRPGSNFTDVIVPDTVNYIGGFNFVQFDKKTITVHFPSDLKYLGKGSPQATTYDVIPFLGEDAVVMGSNFANNKSTKLSIEEGYTTIPEHFCDQFTAKSLIIPNGVKAIEDDALNSWNACEITIPASVEKIGKRALQCVDNRKNNTFIVVAGTYAETWAKESGYKMKVIVPATSIQLTQESSIINVGKSISLKATIEPQNASNKKPEWITTNASVATVSNGTIKAVSCGECDIICKATDGSGVQSICHVSVIQMVQKLQSSEKKVSLGLFETKKIEVEALPDTATDKALHWESSDPSVAIVDNEGIIKSIGGGDCSVIVQTIDGSNKELKIPVHVAAFSLASTEVSLYPNESVEIEVYYPNHNISELKISEKGKVCWTGLYQEHVSNYMYILGNKAGKGQVTVSSGKDSLIINVSVYDKPVETESNGIYYTLDEDGNATITYSEKMKTIPDEIDGHPVIALGRNSLKNINTSELVIPEGIKTLGAHCLEYSKVNTIVLPSTLEFIEAEAFYGSSVKNIHIPASVYVIGTNPFCACSQLSNIEVDKANPYYYVLDNALVDRRNQKLVSAAYALIGLDYSIPDGIEIIGGEAFGYTSTKMETITIPKSVKTIQGSAFSFCNFKKVIIQGATTIGYSFAYCQSLKEVVLPETLETIEGAAFSNCESLKKINLPTSLKSIDTQTFEGIRGIEFVVAKDSYGEKLVQENGWKYTYQSE